jgi:hypothetical protein
MISTEPVVHHSLAGFKESSNSKIEIQSEIIGGVINSGTTGQKGHHTHGMGLNPLSKRHVTGYQPTSGLVRLFSKTGTKQTNPNLRQRKATTPTKPLPIHSPNACCSYANALRKGMEGNDTLIHRNDHDNGYRGHPSGGSRGT